MHRLGVGLCGLVDQLEYGFPELQMQQDPQNLLWLDVHHDDDAVVAKNLYLSNEAE